MLVFDLDDTLYSELEFVVSGFAAVEHHLHTHEFPQHNYANVFWGIFQNQGSGHVFNAGLDQLDVQYTTDQIKALVSVYRHHSPSITARAGIDRILAQTGSNQIRLAVITDGDQKIQTGKLQSLGLLEQFEIILCTDELGPDRFGWKPSTLPFETIESRSGLVGASLAYVGDNPHKDFQGAQQRGWQTVRLRLDDQLHHSAPTPAGVIEVHSVDEILGALN